MGAQVIGTCCGFGVDYIKALDGALPDRIPSPRHEPRRVGYIYARQIPHMSKHNVTSNRPPDRQEESQMESRPLVVVGAGVSGTAAAIEAAKAGVQVTLIDENPISTSMVGLNVPQFFGQRFMDALRNKPLMLERVAAANDALAEAEEAGVEVQLGTCVWGAFRNTETSRALDGPQLGLADGKQSWVMKYDRLIVAAGSRDLGMSFVGSNMAGAMGANGAHSLMSRYQALVSTRAMVSWLGNLGLNTARMALDRGIEVAAIVDVSSSVPGDEPFKTALQGEGVDLYTSHTVKEAVGKADDIESVLLVDRRQ
ncbi:hypothetical protein GBAR_LOCUS16293 [Geodia barretti]|uniref:FAD/NAD(P)-binding domain-containing protein n=1 Tax=Geodia barretti TaxID=519541 RepID=A0AA35SEM4_GEOBA|nr:hypothetical protein GBAR_LOCUS16293 [Geodia barretti]